MPRRRIFTLHNLATTLTGLGMLFLLIAAASKLLDLPEFQRSLDTCPWTQSTILWHMHSFNNPCPIA